MPATYHEHLVKRRLPKRNFYVSTFVSLTLHGLLIWLVWIPSNIVSPKIAPTLKVFLVKPVVTENTVNQKDTVESIPNTTTADDVSFDEIQSKPAIKAKPEVSLAIPKKASGYRPLNNIEKSSSGLNTIHVFCNELQKDIQIINCANDVYEPLDTKKLTRFGARIKTLLARPTSKTAFFAKETIRDRQLKHVDQLIVIKNATELALATNRENSYLDSELKHLFNEIQYTDQQLNTPINLLDVIGTTVVTVIEVAKELPAK